MILRQATTVKCGNPKRLKLGLASVHGWFIYYWGCNLLEPSVIVHILPYLPITFHIHPWGSITIHGDPWYSIMFHNLPAPSTRFYRLPWQSRRFQQVPWYSRRFQQGCWLICQKRKWMGCAWHLSCWYLAGTDSLWQYDQASCTWNRPLVQHFFFQSLPP